MNANEIIEMNENPQITILIEEIIKHKEELLNYYTEEFMSEPMLMITYVMNAAQYGKIVPANEFKDAVCEYLEVDYINESPEEGTEEEGVFFQYKEINFNSMLLSKL